MNNKTTREVLANIKVPGYDEQRQYFMLERLRCDDAVETRLFFGDRYWTQLRHAISYRDGLNQAIEAWQKAEEACPTCGGNGEIPHPSAGDSESEDATIACSECGGDGKKKEAQSHGTKNSNTGTATG